MKRPPIGLVIATSEKYGRDGLDDPLVPIRGDRVRAALKRADMTVSALARRVGASQARLDLIVRGKTKRCRRSVRAAIANAFAVTVGVLGDETDRNVLPPQFRDWEEQDLVETPLAFRVFWRAQCKAATRDKLAVYADGYVPGLDQLVNPAYWRSRLLAMPEGEESLTLEGLSPADRDHVGALLADAMLLILKPWFVGQARLKTRALPRA